MNIRGFVYVPNQRRDYYFPVAEGSYSFKHVVLRYNAANPWVARVYFPARKISKASQEALKKRILTRDPRELGSHV